VNSPSGTSRVSCCSIVGFLRHVLSNTVFSFCPFSFVYCIVCPLMYVFWLLFWFRQQMNNGCHGNTNNTRKRLWYMDNRKWYMCFNYCLMTLYMYCCSVLFWVVEQPIVDNSSVVPLKRRPSRLNCRKAAPVLRNT
jgi:hypothetical protein